MMKAQKVTFRIRGMGLDRLLTRLYEQDIPLSSVIRRDANSVCFDCPWKDAEAARACAEALGFSCKMHACNDLRKQKKRIIAAAVSLALACVILLTARRFVWRIDVRGAGIYAGEVKKYLLEQRITPGTARSEIDIKALNDGLLRRLPHVTWARASLHGLSLRIDITPSIYAQEQSTNTGNIVANCDGVIESINVFAGTPAVKVGDTVRKGDVLIYAHERGADNTVLPVTARGRVFARIWRSATAAVPIWEYTVEATGNVAASAAISCPIYSYTYILPPDFLTQDEIKKRMPIGGVWLPLWREETTHSEIMLEETEKNIEEIQAEAGALAMQNLMHMKAKNDEIIDKWLNYSMIDGETILATATMEVIVDVAQFLAQSSD